MLVWNDLQTVIEHRLYFTKIRYIHNDVDGEKNYIFFYDGQNPYNQGYIDMWTRYVYWNDEVWDLNKTIFESDIPLVLYIYGSDEANNNYQFWSEQTIETDDEGEVLPPNTIKIEEYYIRCQEKEQVRPKDLTQDWKDTNNVRDVKCDEVETEICSCGTQYRWVESGTICDGVNKHQRLRFQYKYDCDSEWVNYDPDIYKIGELIELDSDECGTYEYKEEWEGNWYCGSDLNELYNLSLDETSKYMVKKAYIKKKDETVWTELECETLLEYSLYKENSFECGYKTTKTTYEYDNDLCGSFVEENYGITGLTHTNLYNVTIAYTYETAPYPTNTDDMEEEDWSWVLIDTEYSATLSNIDDCGCGYYYLQWDETDEYICGSELIDDTEILYITNYNNGVIQDAYINTNIPITDDLYYRIKYRVRYASGGIFVGDIASPSDNDDYRFFFFSNYGLLDMENQRVSATTFGGTSSTYEMEIGSAYVKNLSTSSITGSTSYTIADRNRPLYIYAPIANTTNNGCDGVDIYYFQIYNSTGLIRDFIPYEQDGVVGLYDNVENKFYSSDGDGQFVAVYDADYVKTTQYRKQIECKYCSDNFIEETGNERWVSYNTKSCECGYRLTGYSIDNTYEYVCGDDIGMESGYMYYKTYYYEQCDDDINEIYDRQYFKDNIKYEKASHSTSAVTTCKYDEQTLGDTTKVVTKYRTYYDENDKSYKVVECPDRIIVDITEYEKSADCGYMEKWTVSGSVCCGYLETGHPNTLTINDVEGDWLRDGNTFTSNTISNSTETIEKITFTVNRSTTLKIEYDISSESGYDKFYYSNIDGTSANNGGVSGTKTGTYSLSCLSGTHSILLRYAKDGSSSSGRDNVIVTLSIDDEVCTRYAKYNAEYYEYSVDNGESWIIPEPIAYRYGSLIEYNSEECGYVPTLEQWVLICPDITYETAVSGDSCTICETYNNAPTMFAIEKKQISYDGGKTWEDVSPMVTRTERVLKWKADKCGYTGDTFEYRITDEYCEGGHKYGTQTTWVSSDGGKSWTKVEGSEHIVLVEENSEDCS